MCLSCRNNKNPQTVKLSISSSKSSLATKSLETRYASAKSSKTTKPPTYLFRYSIFKEREDQIARAASFLAHLAIRASGSLAVTSVPATASVNSVSPRLVRFGEAVSRPTVADPQEEKTPHMTFSCQPQCFLGYSADLWQSNAAMTRPSNTQIAKKAPAPPSSLRILRPDE